MSINNDVTYRLVLEGNVMLDNVSKQVAESFISKLTPETQGKIILMPVTQLGEQVLFE